MLVPSFIAVILITLFVLYTRKKRQWAYTEKASWAISESDTEEWPKRPTEMPSEKNTAGIYVDRLPYIEDTQLSKNQDIDRFVRIAGENISSLPLYTTDHSDEEHFLTIVHISFHAEGRKAYMDILSLDKDFPLKDNNKFSLLFVDGTQWNFSFSQHHQDEYAASIPLSAQQLSFLEEHPLDKWKLRRDKDDYFTVGSFNFDIRKYIYKPELQAVIQTMASRLATAVQNN